MRAISVCVPVFGTEKLLKKCLESIANQTFKNFEVIVVNDGSQGCDTDGKTCKEIIKQAKKEYKLKIKYIEHKENKGLLEARRSALYAANTDYIVNLDSDDTLPSNALESLYNAAVTTKADIIQGNTNVIYTKSSNEETNVLLERRKKALYEKLKNIQSDNPINKIQDDEILDDYLINRGHNGFVWARIIKTELYKKVFDYIPPIFCIFAEDFIQSFYLNYEAKSYVQINDTVYNYNIDEGISSNKTIDNLSRWERICSTASVFTALYTSIKENNLSLTNDQADKVVEQSYIYLANNIIQLNKVVSKDIYTKAYCLLCDYWGEEFVRKTEEQLKQQGVLNK